jgi:hypothetical protein
MTLLETRRIAEGRTDQEIAALTARVRSEARRMRTVRRYPTGLDLAAAHDERIVRTPALDLLNERLHDTVTKGDGRLVISLPPQEGKTWIARWTCAHVLVRAPQTRLAYISYSANLARTSGRTVRGLIKQHGRQWGISVSRDHADAADWELDGYPGGMISVGRSGTITGRPTEGVLIDDPLKNRQEADSRTILESVNSIWESVVRPRLAPLAFVCLIHTRWAEDDLAGRFEAEGWPVVNIPALADGKALDSLRRPLGVYLESARGRTVAEWEQIRADVGEREWAALYQGCPSPPAGGIFLREWFDRDRVADRPDGHPPIVVVDPADNLGDGDEAGIIVMSTDTRNHIYLGPDYSGHMTTARWVRMALLAAVRHQAAALAYEQSLSGLDRSVRDGWALLHKQARALRRRRPELESLEVDPDAVEATVAELTHPDDPDATREQVRRELLELWPLVDATLAYPDTGPSIRRIKPKGSKTLRAQMAAPLYENRRVHHIGHLAQLEHQQATWQVGQDSPDRMDAATWAVLLASGATIATLAAPSGNLPTRSTRRHGSVMLPRSTRR